MFKVFNELIGQTLSNVENRENELIVFTLPNGDKYALWHDQDCCESVSVEDIIGDLNDLIGSPLLMAEVVTNSTSHPEDKPNHAADSFTWTFYKLATAKGYVTIRWFGSSNGYYSEEVTFGAFQETPHIGIEAPPEHVTGPSDAEGASMIIALQGLVGIIEPPDRAMRNWLAFSQAEKDATIHMHDLLFRPKG